MEINDQRIIKTTKYDDLEPGDTFMYQENLCMKSDYEQDAMCLVDGESFSNMCGEDVIPVNAECIITTQ